LSSALAVSEDRIRRAEYAFEYGQNTKLDVLNARVDATNDSINLLNARQELLNAKRDLNVVLNRDLGSAVAVDTTISFLSRLQLDAFLEDATEKNVVILQTEKNAKINEYDIKVSRSGYLPTVGLNGTYGWNLNQSAQSAFFPGINNETWNFGLGASLTWNLFDGGSTTVRVRNAKLAYENQELLNEQITLEVVKHSEAKRGFVLLPRRWVVERSFAWVRRFRRLAKDYERLPETVVGLHFLAFVCLMLPKMVAMIAASP